MEKIIDLISNYDLLNNILTGTVFFEVTRIITGLELMNKDSFERVIMYYFAGMLISRIGSLFFEKAMLRSRFIEKSESNEYYKAEKSNSKIKLLNTYANIYRTQIANFAILSIVALLKGPDFTYCIISIIVGFVFAFAYRKQVDYIRKNVIFTNNSN